MKATQNQRPSGLFLHQLNVEHVTPIHTHANHHCPPFVKFLLKYWISHFPELWFGEVSCPTSSEFTFEILNYYPTSLKFSMKKLKIPVPRNPCLAASQRLHENEQTFTFSHQSVMSALLCKILKMHFFVHAFD